MTLRKFRWSKVYESQEEELVAFLHARKIAAERHTVAEFETMPEQKPAHDIALWCAEGSMNLYVEHTSVSLQPGDAFRIPGGTPYKGSAGISGCVYYESTHDDASARV